MRFPIDVVFLDRNLQVVKVVESLAPWRMASARGAQATLELAAGEVVSREIGIADKLVFTPRAANGRSNGGRR